MRRLALCAQLLFLALPLAGQSPRIAQVIDGFDQMTLRNQRSPAAAASNDLGPADPTLVLSYVTLVFRQTESQQADMDGLIAAQRTPGSADYMKWLTPAQFAERFGMDEASLAVVRAWLESRGFTIERTALSRNWISFSGSAAQIDSAFHTALHRYESGGVMHMAPASDPRLPAAIGREILAIRGLDDFVPERTGRRGGGRTIPAEAEANGRNGLSPNDLAAIYGIAPLRGEGLDGTGQSIAIVGRSNVALTDIEAYRNRYGLPMNDPSVMAVADPGVSFNSADQGEASLDLEISAAAAPNAKQIYVYANNIEDAIRTVLDQAMAPVLSSSYLSCEKNFNTSGAQTLAMLGLEAQTKGISWVNASGDSGPAGCDRQGITGAIATHGISVNAYAAIPQVTAVGGTEFSENGSPSYWNSVSGSGLSSAIGYIPETAWNDSKTAGYLAASGGGPSAFFTKPMWQTGTPADGARDLPDIALSASWLHDAYLTCNNGACGLNSGGTSAAAPLFAGLAVLLNQLLLKHGAIAKPGLGSLNEMLYTLGQANAPGSPPSPFHDVTSGNNMVPCASGTPDCAAGTTFGYPAAAGYDLATGLGSPDATLLLDSWLAKMSSPATQSTTVVPSVVLSSDSLQQVVTATVKPASTSSTTPTGTVTLAAAGQTLGSTAVSGANGSTTATFSLFNSELPPGAVTFTLRYSGDTTFAPSSATLSAVTPAISSKGTLQILATPDLVFETPSSYGSSWNFTLTLREVGGGNVDLTTPNLINFIVNGNGCVAGSTNCSAHDVFSYFGVSKLGPYQTITAPFKLASAPPSNPPSLILTASPGGSGSSATVTLPPSAVPGPLTFEFDFAGPTSATPTQIVLTVPLLGRPGGGGLQLTGAPGAVLKNSVAPASCQWSQQLLLRETAGTAVSLTQFLAGNMDLSTQIASLWGGTKIPANGALTASICWASLSVPVLVNYSVSGTDDAGNKVSAALTSPYLNPPSSPNALTVTQGAGQAKITGTINLNATANNILLNVGTSSPNQVWSASVFAPGTSPDWLRVSPLSGMSSGTVLVSPVSGLAAGTYTATLIIHSADATPQMVAIPITFTVN